MHSAFSYLALLTLTLVTGVQQLGLSAGWASAAPVEQLATADAPLEIRRAPDGLFYIDADVGGAPLRLLVDTGASMTVLTRADAERLRLAPTAAAAGHIETAGGRIALATAALPDVHIGAHRFEGLSAAIVGSGLPVSLIGQDLLSRFNSIRIEGDRLLLS